MFRWEGPSRGLSVVASRPDAEKKQSPRSSQGLATSNTPYAALVFSGGYTLTLKRRLFLCSNFTTPSMSE